MKQYISKLLFLAYILIIFLTGCISEPEDPVIEEPKPTATAEPIQPTPAPTEETEGNFTVTEELYQQTFEDIESLIEDISQIIIRQDYNAWLRLLTQDYIEHYSDKDVLAKISIDLQKSTGYRVNLRNLRDYFKYIVVNSRIDVKLDKIEFIDENRITAESIINDKPYVLYYLEKINGEWKIGKW